MTNARVIASSLFALASMAIGCSQGTSLLVSIRAGSGVSIGSLDLQVTANGRTLSRSLGIASAAPRLPGSVVVVLPDAPIQVAVHGSGLDVAGNRVAADAMVTSIPHRQLPVDLIVGELPDGGLLDGGADGGASDGSGDGAIGPQDAGKDGGTVCGQSGPATRCADGGYLFCEGFETSSGTTFPNWSGTVLNNWMTNGAVNPGTAIDVAAAPVCAGTNVLHARAVGAAQQAYVHRTFASFPNPVYVRAFYNLASSSPAYSNGLLGLTGQMGTRFLQLSVDPAKPGYNLDKNFGTGTTGIASYSAAIPRDRWICLELMVRFDPQNGELKLLADGVLVGDVTNTVTDPAGLIYDSLHLGEGGTGANQVGTTDLNFDEVVVSSSPIGCN